MNMLGDAGDSECTLSSLLTDQDVPPRLPCSLFQESSELYILEESGNCLFMQKDARPTCLSPAFLHPAAFRMKDPLSLCQAEH